VENGSVKWQESVQIQIIPRINESDIAQNISGLDAASAKRIIDDKVNLRQPPDLSIKNVIKRVPFAAFRIQIQVK
jgi:hypothetical protein